MTGAVPQEAEFWPNMLFKCSRRGATLGMVNGAPTECELCATFWTWCRPCVLMPKELSNLSEKMGNEVARDPITAQPVPLEDPGGLLRDVLRAVRAFCCVVLDEFEIRAAFRFVELNECALCDGKTQHLLSMPGLQPISQDNRFVIKQDLYLKIPRGPRRQSSGRICSTSARAVEPRSCWSITLDPKPQTPHPNP